MPFTSQLRLRWHCSQIQLLFFPFPYYFPCRKGASSLRSPGTTTTAFCLSGLNLPVHHRSVIQDPGFKGIRKRNLILGEKNIYITFMLPCRLLPQPHALKLCQPPNFSLALLVFFRKYSKYVQANAMTLCFTFFLFKRSSNLAFRKGSNGR